VPDKRLPEKWFFEMSGYATKSDSQRFKINAVLIS
jgi:hypothetical protein